MCLQGVLCDAYVNAEWQNTVPKLESFPAQRSIHFKTIKLSLKTFLRITTQQQRPVSLHIGFSALVCDQLKSLDRSKNLPVSPLTEALKDKIKV